MGVSRRDEKHNADLVDEISDSFNRALHRKKSSDGEHSTGQESAAPRFVITGDQRNPPGGHR